MARSSEDGRTEIESPNTQHSVPVVSHVSDLISLDPQSELFLETPPPDVVSCISACFEQFTSTLERRDASVHKSSSDSDSGESLFITQSVTKAVRTERRDGSTKRPESISDDSEGVANSRSKNEGNRYEEGSDGQHVVCPKGQKRIHYFPPQKATFPFLLKLHRRQHLPRKKHQILENSEMGGFLKCMKKFEEGYVKTERAISPYMLESELSDDTEGDDHNNDHEVTKVDKTIFVPSYHKGNFNKWYSQSILESWIQDSLSKDNNNDQLLNVNEKENKTHFTKKKQTSGSVKKQSNKKCKVPKSKAVAKTVPESSCVSLSEERGKHETHEVFTSCSDAEPSDSSNCGQPLNNQVIQCAENSDGNNFGVIEETRAHSVEAVSQIQHEDDMRSGTDNDLPNKSNDLILPQGGDISVQNEIQQTDSDFGSLDLFSPLNSPEHKINQIHKTASITANMESDQDSDVTQIETGRQFESIFGPGTLSWGDDEHPAHENDESDITEMETEESVFVFGPRTLTKQFTVQNINCTKFSETQKTGQSSVVLHTELKTRPKKKKTKSSSHKDTEVTGIEETVNVQPSSEQIPLADEPLREVYSSSCEHFIVGKQRKMEIETYTQDSPLFKNCEMTFLKRKRKSKKKMGAAVLIECDTNVDVSQTENSEFQVDVAELKTTCRENGELCDVENRVTNEEQIAASVLQSEETSELLEEILSTLADGGVIKKAKKKKIMCKLKEREDAEPGVENQSVEVVQFSEPQTTELTLKRTKKKRKDKERVKTAYVEENSAIDIPSNGTLDSDRPTELRVNKRNQSSEAPEAGQPKHMQTSEEISRWVLPNITRLKSVKKKKKKERDETESRNESVDLNMSSMSQFDASLRVDEQQEDQVIQERWSNDNAGEHLEGNTASIFNVAKCKNKSVNVRSPSQSDYIIGPEKHASCMQSENTAEPNNWGSDDIFITEDKQKNAKKQKLKKRKTIELASDIEDIVQFQYSESQTTDLLTRRTKQKRTNKDRERTVSSSNEHLEHMDDRPPEMRGINVIQSSEATETDQIEHTRSSKGITRDPSPSETILSSAKKRKKKRDASSVSQGSLEKKKKDQSKECQNESIDLNLDVSSVSQESLGKKKKKRDQSKECQNKSVDLNLDASSVSQESLGKKKKKKGDQSKEYQNESVNLNLDVSSVSQESLRKKKKKKRNQSKCQNESVNLNLDVSFVSQESLGKKKKKKGDQSKEYQNESVNLNLDASSVSQESLGKKKKKKRNQSKCQNESVDLNLDASSVSQFDVTALRAQKMIERQSNAAENLEGNAAHILNVAKLKNKSQNASAPSQVDIIGLENSVSDSQSGSTAELVEKTNSSILSDNTLYSKYKWNKKKKHKLKEQEDAKPNAVTHSVDNVHSVEMDQFSESQTAELTLKRTKKKRKDKERKKAAYIEENGTTDVLSIETFETETDHSEHLQTSEQAEQYLLPNVTRIKSVKKKKKKSASEVYQHDSAPHAEHDFPLDVILVSQCDKLTDRSNIKQTIEVRPNDVEHLESNTEAKLNDTKPKKRKRSSFSINYSSVSSTAQMQESVTPERKMKKKRF